MGARNSKSQSGIQTHELYTFVGYIAGVYDDVLAKRISTTEGRNLIQYSLSRLSRYTLESSRSRGPNKIFVGDEPLVEIYEKYRDIDGVSGWSIVLQFKPTAKTFKALHGIPGSISVSSDTTQQAITPTRRQEPMEQRVPQRPVQTYPQGPRTPQGQQPNMNARNDINNNVARRSMMNHNYPQGPREPSLIDEMSRFAGPINYGDVGRMQNTDQADIAEFNLGRHG